MNEKKIDFRCKIVSGRIVISLKDWISGICWTAIYLNWQLHVKNQQYKHKNKVWNKFKVNNTDNTPIRRSGVFILNFEHVSQLILVFTLLTLSG